DSSHDEILLQNHFIIRNSGFFYSFSYVELTLLLILSSARLRRIFDLGRGLGAVLNKFPLLIMINVQRIQDPAPLVT
ncbi:hypothetical protein, partial [Nitrosomonas communis]|uniref:hypothetical protein n=1 Tax=Nitrosomonas communis TaxID=44574 RepID=UPI001CA37A9E